MVTLVLAFGPTSVTESVSPAHAAAIPLTFTCVTFPALSTSRVAVSDVMPHEVTAALPAEGLVDPRARVAAAANAVKTAVTRSAKPSVLERAFMSIPFGEEREGARRRGTRAPVRRTSRRVG